MAVAVDIADGDAVAVPAGESADARAIGDVLEGAVASIVEQAIPRACRRRSGVGGWSEGTSLDAVDIKPAVAVIVQEGESAAGGLGQLVEGSLGIIVNESEADGLGIVGKGELAAGPRPRTPRAGAGSGRQLGPRVVLRGEGISFAGRRPGRDGPSPPGPRVRRDRP